MLHGKTIFITFALKATEWRRVEHFLIPLLALSDNVGFSQFLKFSSNFLYEVRDEDLIQEIFDDLLPNLSL